MAKDGDVEEQLPAMTDRIARAALRPIGVPDGWPPSDAQHQRYVNAVRNALGEHAAAGGFARWGVTTSSQLRAVTVAIGFDSTMRHFVLNPDEMANQLIRAGLGS